MSKLFKDAHNHVGNKIKIFQQSEKSYETTETSVCNCKEKIIKTPTRKSTKYFYHNIRPSRVA